MCGIAGLIERPARSGQDELRERALVMARALRHRGPDKQGVWADGPTGVALGHARLSILDLSPLGDQPMQSMDGRYVLSFNGEIYNFRQLKDELEKLGHRFRGTSDTEVMLAAFLQWGPRDVLARLDGMFAFALWDRERRELWLARDRFGEKPLYYGWHREMFVFGSELKALKALPGFSAEIDREAVDRYMRFACVPAPGCIYRGFRKLPPGNFLVLQNGEGGLPEPRPYWRLRELAQKQRQSPFAGSDQDAIDELDRLLRQAVRGRMVSDVPLGAFLSGGIDSSLIVALMQAQSGEPIRTFTVGFDEKDYNEADQARAVAKHLGTHHSEQIMRAEEGMKALEQMPRIYDEPFSDPSEVATYLVAQHARRHVTVCLSGDAGDELFAGYHRHFRGQSLWNRMRRLPPGLRRIAAAGLSGVPSATWKSAGRLTGNAKPAIFADQVRKFIDVLPARSHAELYQKLVQHQRGPEGLVLGVPEFRSSAERIDESQELGSVMAEFQYLDATTYLPDDILTKVDRATMAVSLEARVPFLAPEVVAFAWSLPDAMKIRDGQGKWILRRLLERYLPSELILKPKAGFRVPIGEWLRGPLRGWCEELLDERKLREQGFLNPAVVRDLWSEHLSGKRDREFILWGILMFQAWLAG